MIFLTRFTSFCLLAELAFGQAASTAGTAREVLRSGSRNGDPAVRRETALALGLLGTREPSTSLVRELVADSDVQVRVAAVGSIADLRDKTLIPVLKTALDDSVPEVAFAGAKALWVFKQPEGKQVLLSILEGETRAQSNYFRRQYRSLMRTFSTPKGALLFTLDQGLGFVPIPGIGEGYSALHALLWESDFSPQASVAILLAKENDAETRTVLIEALEDDDWSVRAAAVQALAMRNEPSRRDKLVPLLEDGSSRVRYRAAAAFLRLDQLAGKH